MSNVFMTSGADGNILHLAGHIDSLNASEAEALILELDDGKKLAVDLEQLEYISSAGLRILLRLLKKHPELKLFNASSSVYEILDVTGFTEMMPVARAYRKVSIDGCEVIGRGANGNVYRIDPDTVVKVYKNADSLESIERERILARKALVLGIPTAISYDVVSVDGHFASMFELIDAKSFSGLIADHPERLDEYVQMYAELLHLIHATEDPDGGLPDEREEMLRTLEKIRGHLPEETFVKLAKLLREIPASRHVIHGDCHTKNILLQNGETILIDMDTLAAGDALWEFAFMFNTFRGYSLVDHGDVQRFLGFPYETGKLLYRKLIGAYYGIDDPETILEKEEKFACAGLPRILNHTLQNGNEVLRSRVTEELIRLTAKYDSLL